MGISRRTALNISGLRPPVPMSSLPVASRGSTSVKLRNGWRSTSRPSAWKYPFSFAMKMPASGARPLIEKTTLTGGDRGATEAPAAALLAGAPEAAALLGGAPLAAALLGGVVGAALACGGG